ncbi:Aste57867_16844 [Aphanomyces stellatus]|uniref:Aste57867_16844 protein n=1 Tax=Aphanomyces stellatus TaxID=120398 RepID=A0A485L7Y1_9STRA|nr:hypothetical protein As57867_016786 [Aphanomyces stellatus]VFT93608.1 Aste57867_16844 [Aphanomyces stellatus]
MGVRHCGTSDAVAHDITFEFCLSNPQLKKDPMTKSSARLDALLHALPGAGGCLAAGSILSTLRGRRLRGPPSIFVALGVGVGVFRYVNHRRGNKKSKTAAWVASIVLFKLCSDDHRFILLSYACVETLAQFYAAHRCLPWLAEQGVSMAIVSRLVYANLVHPEWMLPAHLHMMDHQSSLRRGRLEAIRANLHSNATTRCTSLHPARTCAAFAHATSLKLVRRSAEIFVPLHGLSLAYTLCVTHQSIDVGRAVVDCGRSMLFMTASYLLAYSTSCVLPQTQCDNKRMIFFTSLAPFLAQYIEPTRRRAAIVKAVACYSLITVLIQLKTRYIRLPRETWLKLGALVFASCMTYILQHPERQSRAFIEYVYGYKTAKERPTQTNPKARVA